ncbi:MAG: hypothetical protein U1D69_03965, partial [Polynucleobacter sp.]|nr:hypothetical protein [Polynucleobacter sp.]
FSKPGIPTSETYDINFFPSVDLQYRPTAEFSFSNYQVNQTTGESFPTKLLLKFGAQHEEPVTTGIYEGQVYNTHQFSRGLALILTFTSTDGKNFTYTKTSGDEAGTSILYANGLPYKRVDVNGIEYTCYNSFQFHSAGPAQRNYTVENSTITIPDGVNASVSIGMSFSQSLIYHYPNDNAKCTNMGSLSNITTKGNLSFIATLKTDTPIPTPTPISTPTPTPVPTPTPLPSPTVSPSPPNSPLTECENDYLLPQELQDPVLEAGNLSSNLYGDRAFLQQSGQLHDEAERALTDLEKLNYPIKDLLFNTNVTATNAPLPPANLKPNQRAQAQNLINTFIGKRDQLKQLNQQKSFQSQLLNSRLDSFEAKAQKVLDANYPITTLGTVPQSLLDYEAL